MKEANIDFTRTMNKIVFDLHLQHASAEGLMPLVSALPRRCVRACMRVCVCLRACSCRRVEVCARSCLGCRVVTVCE